MDFDNGSIHGIMIKETNREIVKEGIPISIPFKWIKAVGDAVLLFTFPEKITYTGTTSS